MGSSAYTVVSFPRSGNNYLVSLIELAFPNVKYKATHSAIGLTLDSPITLIRKPNECIPSWIAFYPKSESFEDRLPKVIAWYERFHSQLLESRSSIFCFYKATSNTVEFIKNLECLLDEEQNAFDYSKISTNKNHTRYEKLDENDTRLNNCFNLYYQLQEKITS